METRDDILTVAKKELTQQKLRPFCDKTISRVCPFATRKCPRVSSECPIVKQIKNAEKTKREKQERKGIPIIFYEDWLERCKKKN